MEAKGKSGLSGRAAWVNEKCSEWVRFPPPPFFLLRIPMVVDYAQTWGRHGAVVLRAGEVSEGCGRKQLEIAMFGEHYKKWL